LHATIALVVFAGVTAAFRAVSHSLAGADALLPKTANRLIVPCISIFLAAWIIHLISARKQSI
jgi:hypothetical protein